MHESSLLPWPTFPEELAIGELIQNSEKFRGFYQGEREKIGGIIYWTQDSTLPDGIVARSRKRCSGERVIHLRRIPIPIEDAFTVAHELEHLVLDAEGFPVTLPEPNSDSDAAISLCAAINSMLSHPIINARLQEYGFGWRECKGVYAAMICEFKRLPRLASGGHHPMELIFNYVTLILDLEAFNRKEKYKLELYFCLRYPGIAGEGKKLRSLMRETGFQTPVRQSELIIMILDHYRLWSICDLHLQ